jgi:Bacteriocin-protection, YdeI or OmpD-Associated
MSETLLEKLQLKDEKSLLIQGLPSSIEKQFAKLAFAKNVTPLLKSRKIDFALVFAVNETQLKGIIEEVLPALHVEGKLWVAYPKLTSKIATTLNRDCSWTCITESGYEGTRQVALDHVWIAMGFKRVAAIPFLSRSSTTRKSLSMALTSVSEFGERQGINAPDDFVKELNRSRVASHFFDKLSSSNKKEYVSWITKAKKEQTRSQRLEAAIEKLIMGKRSPSEC